ncbi:MAG TPA: nucleotidyltransferase family protein [Aggregatilineales bacterium]|nr:nucleotidyltransferase family protein [Anaerolineales bacterium]HRE49163.1 nucleotidyltransferase family protein [Aggregatilineales bacterium]
MSNPLSLSPILAALITKRRTAAEIPPSLWGALIAHAEREGLLPMLVWAVKTTTPDILKTPELAAAPAAAVPHTIRSLALRRAQHRLETALRAAAIPTIWLKGAALGLTIYPDPALRPMIDLDVLVPFEAIEGALRAAEEVGFHLYEGGQGTLGVIDKAAVAALMHHYQLSDGTLSVEIHFTLVNDPALLSANGLAWFWMQTAQMGGFTIFNPEASLLHLAAHLILHDREQGLDLRHLLDIHLLVERGIDWTAAAAGAARLEWTYALERALQHTQRAFGTILPESIFITLKNERTASEWARQGKLISGVEGVERTARRLGKLSWAARVAFLLRVIIPRQGYIRERYHLPLFKGYPRYWQHMVGIAWRWLRYRLRRG